MRERLVGWIILAMCLSVILAACDVWSAMRFRRTIFSTTSWKMKDGGSTGHNGFLYSFAFWRSLDGAYGPEIWFWFTPIVIDASNANVKVRFVWNNASKDVTD
jgi:hypothetical protein